MVAVLAQLAHIDLVGLDPRLRQLSISAACDVDNPLCGEKDASVVFRPLAVAQLDVALRHYGELMDQVTSREIVRQPSARPPAIGIAGGLAPDYQVVHLHGIDTAFSVLDRIVTLEEAPAAAHNLEVTARNVTAVWRLVQG